MTNQNGRRLPKAGNKLGRQGVLKPGQASLFFILSFFLFTTESIHTPTVHATDSISVSSNDLLEDIEFLKEETVSIAVLHEQPISEAPSNVYVITDEDIRHSGAIDLPTVLRRIPGMEVIQMTGADFNVSVRGDNQLRANKLLVMVDGRSIYLDIQGEVFWKALPITLPEIKRIEVLKGPASALYGFNAFDGIINIITKSPEEMDRVTLQVGGGEFGTLSSSAVYAGSYNNLDYRLSVGRDQNNQWDNRNSLAFRSQKFNTQFNYKLDDQSKMSISGGFLDSNRYDGPIVDTVTISQTPSIAYFNLGYERPNFFVRAWWTRYTQPALTNVNPLISSISTITDKNGVGPDQMIEANTSNIDIQHTIQPHATNRLTYGINYRHNQASSNFLSGDSREDRVGLYIQDEWKVIPELTVVGGFRCDLDAFINPTYSPRFSIIYKVDIDHTLRASFAQAFRSPTIFEEQTLSRGLILPASSTVLRGSNQLEPEEITSYEIGYQGWYFKHRLRARLDLFLNHISDLISRDFMAGSMTTLTFFNGAGPATGGGSADIYGLEAGAEFLITPWLTGFANYAFQEIGQTYTSSNRVQRHAPRFKVNTGLRTEFETGVSGEATIHYVGSSTYAVDPALISLAPFAGNPPPETKVGSYILLNVRGAYKFWNVKGKKRAEFAISVFNALNDKHKEHPLGETIGSRVMGWLTINF